MDLNDYILVTPCKNEEKGLIQLIDSIVEQTIIPKLWVIVDDGSTDMSSMIIYEATKKYDWIKSIRLSVVSRDLGIHISNVYRAGFDFAISYCNKNSINYHYIGVIDSDLYVDSNYFEFLIKEFEINPKLGIASGHVGNEIDGRIIWSIFRDDLPSGGARLWSKACFEDTGGYAITCSPDSVSNVKAMLHGWDTRQFKEIKLISIRPHASAQGQWFGHKKLGSNNYYIGYSPLHALLKGITLLYSKDAYNMSGVGLSYIYGYFHAYFLKRPRIEDKEIIEYYQKKWLRNSICIRLQQKNTK